MSKKSPAKTPQFFKLDPHNEYKSYGINSVTLSACLLTAACLFTDISTWRLCVSVPVTLLFSGTEFHRKPR